VGEIERVASASVMIDRPVLFRGVGAFTESTNLDRRWVLCGLSGPVETGVGIMAAAESILAGFRRLRAGDRGLIAAPWTPLAFLCCRSRRHSCCDLLAIVNAYL
jgi:hypothetical protein